MGDDALSSRLAKILLGLLVLAHVVLGFWYGSSTPYRTPGIVLSNGRAPVPDVGAPDERQHANYVAHLLEGQGFPVFDPNDPNLIENYESHQPPAFYLAAAGWAKVAGLSPEAIRSPEGKALRWINLLFGALTVAGAYVLGRWGYGRRDVGLVAAAFVALLPMNVALSGAVSNDPLLLALCAWTLAFAAKGIRQGWTIKTAIACGVLTGLAILTKTTGIALLPILLVAAILRRPSAKEVAAVAVPCIVLALPWILRNQSLYHEPFALSAFQKAFSNSAQAKTFIDDMGFGLFGYLINWLGWWTARSFIGAFGYMDIWLNETGLPQAGPPNTIYRLALVLLIVAFLGWLMRVREADHDERKVHLLGVIAALIVTALFLRFTLQYFQAQARYLFPALAPIACGVAWGALRLSKNDWKVALAAVALPLLGIAIWAGTILPAEFAKRT